MELFDIVTRLNAAFGPSGDEDGVASVIADLARSYVDEITTDVMGNLICHKRGSGPRIMFAAHMDSLGFVVTHVEEEGFLRVAALGGISFSDVLHTPVRFKNGVHGVLAADGDVSVEKLTVTDLYIDIGATSREQALSLVELGDVAVYDTPVVQQGDVIFSPYLDNRISCAVQLLAMEQLGQTENDLFFVFTTQEELGLRGAKTATYAIEPDYGIVLDVTGSVDTPNAKHADSSKQGGGAAIKVMDRSVICHPEVVDKLKQLSREQEIPHQLTVKRTGGTDAGAMQPSRAGVRVSGITVPCRYAHSPCESICIRDALACVRLVCAFAQAQLEKV